MPSELPPERLRRSFDLRGLDLRHPDGGQPLSGVIGQDRAVAALKLGLGIREKGFNLYAAGPPGIGKMTAVRVFLEDAAAGLPTPPDLCYVNDFEDPYQPRILAFPAGRGREFQQDVRRLIEHARDALPGAFESEEFTAQREGVAKSLEKSREKEMAALKERAGAAGYSIRSTPLGIIVMPLLQGRPVSEKELEALPPAVRKDLVARGEAVEADLQRTLKRIRGLETAAKDRLGELEQKAALAVVGGMMEDLREKYDGMAEVLEHLDAVQEEVLANIEAFKSPPAASAMADGVAVAAPWLSEQPFRRYDVNLFVDNAKTRGAPVVFELNPSYHNLFGRIEKESQLGTLVTDFTMIRAGSLHKASGGFLVLPVEDLLRSPMAWDGLKRCMRAGEIQIEELAERMGFVATKTLQPRAVPLDVKVILVGRLQWYRLLQFYDDEFPEFFKVKADFDTSMPLTDKNTGDFLAFLRTFSSKAELKRLDAGAVAEVLGYACRLAEDQEKLSMRFGAVADIVREAHYYAQAAGSREVKAEHVRKALDQKVYRSAMLQERIQEMIAQGAFLLTTDGSAVGQVNGLEVLDLGDYAFGKPARITASVGPGREGVVDIEREVDLGGPVHAKGVLILTGFLTARFARERPLALSARLVFEQSYEGVEGDSASCAELYALLSALAELPLRQDLAVTGSVNQRGEVQAIGGVNEKIEGFFEVCRARGLTGRQGVLIPRANTRNLMLRPEVIEAVRSGRFHIWPVGTVDEGMELLTGLPAAAVDARVAERLREMDAVLKESGAPGD